MQDSTQQLIDLQDQVTKIQGTVDSLSQSFYKNNFSSSQTFNKDIVFSVSLQVPHYSSAPSVGAVGQLIEVGGKLYICTIAGSVASPATWTLVGTQS